MIDQLDQQIQPLGSAFDGVDSGLLLINHNTETKQIILSIASVVDDVLQRSEMLKSLKANVETDKGGPQVQSHGPQQRSLVAALQDYQHVNLDKGSDTSFIHSKRQSRASFMHANQDLTFRPTGQRVPSIAFPQNLPNDQTADVGVIDKDQQHKREAESGMFLAPNQLRHYSRFGRPSFQQTQDVGPMDQQQGFLLGNIENRRATHTELLPNNELPDQSRFRQPSVVMTQQLDPEAQEHGAPGSSIPIKRIKGNELLPHYDDLTGFSKGRQSFVGLINEPGTGEFTQGLTFDAPGTSRQQVNNATVITCCASSACSG